MKLTGSVFVPRLPVSPGFAGILMNFHQPRHFVAISMPPPVFHVGCCGFDYAPACFTVRSEFYMKTCSNNAVTFLYREIG